MTIPSPKKPRSVLLVYPDIALVPYLPLHLPHYNAWMSDPQIREATGSEPLTMEEEEEMCEKWKVDEEKYTFIIVSLSGDENEITDIGAFWGNKDVEEVSIGSSGKMVGDVNLFLGEFDPDEGKDYVSDGEGEATGNGGGDEDNRIGALQAELEIMVAEKDARRKVRFIICERTCSQQEC